MTRPPDSPQRAAHRARIAGGFGTARAVLDVSHLPAPRAPGAPDESFSVLVASDKLERLVDRSFDALNDIFDMDPNDYIEEESRLGVARLHLSAAEKALNTQVRVDQNRLRQRNSDTLGDVLQELRDREKRLGPVIEHAAE